MSVNWARSILSTPPSYILKTHFNIILPSTFIITVSFPKSMLAHVHFLAHDVKILWWQVSFFWTEMEDRQHEITINYYSLVCNLYKRVNFNLGLCELIHMYMGWKSISIKQGIPEMLGTCAQVFRRLVHKCLCSMHPLPAHPNPPQPSSQQTCHQLKQHHAPSSLHALHYAFRTRRML